MQMAKADKPAPRARKPASVESTGEWRRQFPRFGLDGAAWIRTPDGASRGVRLRDISMRGIQIVASPETACAIHPAGEFITRANAPELGVKLRLPMSKQMMDVVVRCRVTYFKFQPDGNVMFGLAFSHVDGKATEQLVRYFTLSMTPATE